MKIKNPALNSSKNVKISYGLLVAALLIGVGLFSCYSPLFANIVCLLVSGLGMCTDPNLSYQYGLIFIIGGIVYLIWQNKLLFKKKKYT